MISVRLFKKNDKETWDSYVQGHSSSVLYHLSGWKDVIEKTYGHKTYYLLATKECGESKNNCKKTNTSNPTNLSNSNNTNIVGILPLVHLNHLFLGNSLISIPFFDMGGILADDVEIERLLFLEAVNLGKKLRVNNIELRHKESLKWIAVNELGLDIGDLIIQTRTHKVRMLLELSASSDKQWESFNSKHRNKILKPSREGVKTVIGGINLLDDFYDVFCVNMRDLGSPVHSKNLIKNVLEEFPEKAKLIVAYHDKKALACGFFIGFKNILENPWSSSLRQYSQLRPNYLLYWSMVEYGASNGFQYFDFGRSSPDEGTFEFKKHWGAKPEPLYWYYISSINRRQSLGTAEKSGFRLMISLWQKLPVILTRLIGPKIRKHIGL